MQPLYFNHNEFEKIIFNSWNAPNGPSEMARVSLGKLSYVKVDHVIIHSKGLCTNGILVKILFNSCWHPYDQGIPKCKKYRDFRGYLLRYYYKIVIIIIVLHEFTYQNIIIFIFKIIYNISYKKIWSMGVFLHSFFYHLKNYILYLFRLCVTLTHWSICQKCDKK